MSRMIPVGKVIGPAGLKGWLKVRMYTRGLKSLEHAAEVRIKGPLSEKSYDVTEISLGNAIARVKLKGIDSLEDAASLKGCELLIDEAVLPRLGTGEYYHCQLIGMEVFERGRLLGTIEHIFETGANDVYCVRKGGEEHLIPAVDSVIKKVDTQNNRMEVELMEVLGDD